MGLRAGLLMLSCQLEDVGFEGATETAKIAIQGRNCLVDDHLFVSNLIGRWLCVLFGNYIHRDLMCCRNAASALVVSDYMC